jgi:arylsulfatase A-like enzyme
MGKGTDATILDILFGHSTMQKNLSVAERKIEMPFQRLHDITLSSQALTLSRINREGKTPPDWRKEIYYRYWTNHAIRPAHFAIRSDRYKLIFYYAQNLDMTDTGNFEFTPSWDFYDLQNDPHENHNAYNDPKYAPVIKQMKKQLLNLRKEVGDTDEKYPEMQELLEKYYNKDMR